MKSEQFIKNLLAVLPHWHYIIDKGLKKGLKDKMSLESYYCLQTLRSNGPMTMSELAGLMRISRQQATQLIDRLCEYDFVRRLQNDEDRRSIKIEITEGAQDYIDHVYYADTRYAQVIQDKTGEDGVEDFNHAIEILLRILPRLE